MNKIKKVIIAAIGVLLSAVFLCGCTEAERVTYNVQKEADNFNVTRRLSVINARSDKPVLELIGNFSISNNEANELVVTIEIQLNIALAFRNFPKVILLFQIGIQALLRLQQ